MICGVEKASLNGFCQGIYTRESTNIKGNRWTFVTLLWIFSQCHCDRKSLASACRQCFSCSIPVKSTEQICPLGSSGDCHMVQSRGAACVSQHQGYIAGYITYMKKMLTLRSRKQNHFLCIKEGKNCTQVSTLDFCHVIVIVNSTRAGRGHYLYLNPTYIQYAIKNNNLESMQILSIEKHSRPAFHAL